MGTWSRPLFTNRPEWKVNLGWFKEGGKCRILNHYSIQTESEEEKAEKIISLEEFVRERIHEHSKIADHLGRDQMSGWQTFFDLLVDYNQGEGGSTEDVEIHLFNIDGNYPYKLSYRAASRNLFLCEYPSGHVYYSRVRREMDISGEYEKVIKFVESKYRRHHGDLCGSISCITYILENKNARLGLF